MRSDKKPVILITGSEGLIGDALVRALSRDYHTVGFDVTRPQKDPEELDFINCDLTKDASVAGALDELERRSGLHIVSVVHLAAYYDFSGAESPLYRELTIEGTRRLLRGLQRFEVEQFVFSSTHILMKPSKEGEPITETSPVDPTWAYPKSKLKTEQLIQQERGKIPAVILRIAGVYNEDGHTVPIAQQIDRIVQKDLESYVFPGDPDSGQAYIHLDDLVDMIRRVIERRKALGEYDVFLAAEPEKLEYDELQDIIGQQVHGHEWPTIRIPKALAKAGAWITSKIDDDSFIQPWMIDRADDDYPVSIEHAREKLGWTPRHRLRDTLPVIIERMKRDPEKWRRLNGLTDAKSEDREIEASKR
jgi:nucleoside-diphosphate-sugar epimerase